MTFLKWCSTNPNKILLFVILLLICNYKLWGQAPGSGPSLVVLNSPPPSQVYNVGTSRTCGGTILYYYWVIANYPRGKSQPSAPSLVTTNTLGGICTVTVGWSLSAGATNYDVLRTTVPFLPSGASNIAIAVATSGPTVTDNGAAPSSYTPGSVAQQATANMRLDNQNYPIPVITFNDTYPISPTFIGTGVPTISCVVGQIYFRTDATPGSNLYLCYATSTWVQLTGGGGGGGGITNCALSVSTTTTPNDTLSVAQPCLYMYGNQLKVLGGTATVQLSSGPGSSTMFVQGTGNGIEVGSNPGSEVRSCNANCNVYGSAITNYIPESFPIGSVVYNNNQFGVITTTAPQGSIQKLAVGSSGNLQKTILPDGSAEFDLGTTFDVVSRISRPWQTGTEAAKPTTGCFQGMSYYATDTSTLYKNDSTTTTCSWSAIGGSSGGGWQEFPLASAGVAALSGGWNSNTAVAVAKSANNYFMALQMPNTGIGVDEYYKAFDIPSTYSGGAIKFRIAWIRGSMVGYGNINIGVRSQCFAYATPIISPTYTNPELSMTWTINAPQDVPGTVEVGEVTLNPNGVCSAGGTILVNFRRIASTGSVAVQAYTTAIKF